MAQNSEKTHQDLSSALTRLDALIRQGQSSTAVAELQSLLERHPKLPREFKAPFAKVARRMGLNYVSLQIMRPLIHPRMPLNPPASSTEKAVYAGTLAKVGAFVEALSMLKNIPADENPEVYFHQCSVHFRHWEYGKAIPLLKKYVKHTALSDYERLAGQINLAAAYVTERKTAEAAKLLQELLIKTKPHSLSLLHGNALELAAQNEMFAGHFKNAEDYLSIAKKRLGKSTDLSEFFIRKWMAILDLLKSGSKAPETHANLKAIRNEAVKRKHWETQRECDFYLSLGLKDETLFSYVYSGTPFSNYKKRMISQMKIAIQVDKKFVWNVYQVDQPKNLRIFDLTKGQENGTKISLPIGSVSLRALTIFCQDFYRPVSEGYLFSQLFPDEYFNPESSPARVSQALLRLRAWFEENKIPLDIETEQGDRRLIARADYAIQIGKIQTTDDSKISKIETLKSKWPYQSFTAKQAANELSCSTATAQRLLTWALKNKKILTSGKASTVIYRFAK